MATYQPIPVGDYKPMGVLAGIYAGENAANQEQQNRIANLAQLFDQRQKDLTYRAGEFKLGEDQYAAPNQRLVSDVTGQLSREQLNTPGYFPSEVNARLGRNQVDIATGAEAAALSQGKIDSGKATNVAKIAEQEQKGHITAIQNLIPMLDQQGALATSQFISDNYPNPKQRDLLLQAIGGGVDGMQALLNRMAASDPAQINRMAEQRSKNEGALAVANAGARATAITANRAYQAAVNSADKNLITASIATSKAWLDNLKIVQDTIDNDLNKFKTDESKLSKEYKDLITERTKVKTALNTANTQLTALTDKMIKMPSVVLSPDGTRVVEQSSNQVLDYSKLP